MKRLVSINASAGSGKTYQLAKRYIQILSKEEKIPIGSIVAITFTNKASHEMKERIFKFLKSIYKGERIFNDLKIERDRALKLLVDIINNYDDFYVTTIDSFMNRILKAFSVELKIYPDYDITFDENEIFEIAFNDFITDKDNEDFVISLLIDLLNLGYSGINPEFILKNALAKFKENFKIENYITLEELKRYFNESEVNFDRLKEKFEENVEEIKEIFKENKKLFNGNKIKGLRNLKFDKFSDKFRDVTELIQNNRINNIFKEKIDDEIKEKILRNLKECCSTYLKYVIFSSQKEYESIGRGIKKLNVYEEEIRRSLNIINWQSAIKLLCEKLQQEGYVTYAYASLGEKVYHYLIDEFQDTSIEQFYAISPLIENAISNNGSLFVVGDKKQAIYAWRGGDYRLFNKIVEDFKMDEEFIETNYRSRKNIVEFNNRLFGSIVNGEIEIFESFDEEIRRNLIEVYRDFKQIPVDGNIGGYVEVELKEIKDNFEEEEFYKDKLISTLKFLIKEKGISQSEIMILLREKKQIEKVISWIKEELMDINFITEDSMRILSNVDVKKILIIASAIAHRDEEFYWEGLREFEIDKNFIKKFAILSHELSPYEIFCKVLDSIDIDFKNSKIYIDRLLEEVLKLTEENKGLDEIVEYFYNNKDIVISIPEKINAIKIMTIHKSKGLESGTVIIPFYKWNVYDPYRINLTTSVNLNDIVNENICIFTKIDKKLRCVSKSAESLYREEIKKKFIEAINLMYVANTRAKDNLFIFGTYRLTSKKEYPKVFNVSHLLHSILFRNSKVYKITIGDLIIKREKKDNLPEELNDFKISSNLRNHIKFSPFIRDFTLTGENKLYGDLFHLAISYIKKIEDENVIYKAYSIASKILGYENKKVIEDLILTISELKDYFFDVDDVWTEKEIVSDNGEILRIDRLVKKNGKFFILEFKTGEFSEKHIFQVRKYLSVINNATGYLYYVKDRKLVHVS